MSAIRAWSSLGEYFPDKPILTSSEAARLMGFRSGDALAKARLKGRLPIQMFQLPGRRGWFVATDDVRAWVEEAITQTTSGALSSGSAQAR
jgi:hypothetical protein